MATQSTETNDICDGATLVERHELYYFDFAVFQVQHKLFRVPTNAFLASNPSFFEIFATPKLASNADVPECQSELQPSIIKPQDVSADHFQGLLLVLYPFTRTAETFEEWIGALDLATRWSLPDIRVKAIRALSSPIVGGEKSAAEFAVIARRYHIKEWLLRAFVELVLSEDLSLNSISQEALDPEGLDWETLARLFSIRLQLIQWIRTRLACFVCGKKEWFCSDDCRSTDSSHSSESTRVRAKTRILEVFAEEFEGMKDEEVSLLHEKPVITKQAKLEGNYLIALR
ncbi:hypothetical protein CPB83DRAFT_652003 [Crepidotus variabilis]|uniref:BTB domain-containing protein n=1 Tax=Crepidotus variabilis TaxID=179855 RepID=A0A9P6JK39_9AGAR|nr:hypothetical protein CPB83DRAFT_652003 [Crepidotus variabilis]